MSPMLKVPLSLEHALGLLRGQAMPAYQRYKWLACMRLQLNNLDRLVFKFRISNVEMILTWLDIRTTALAAPAST